MVRSRARWRGADTRPGLVLEQPRTLGGGGPECATIGSVVQSLGFNLFGPLAGCAFAANMDILDQDPQLGPLADNGGPTWTHALDPASPAIDAGNPAGCLGPGDVPLTDDQRGELRPAGDACDIGAFEYQP
jgi:hypothetical protein